MRWVILKIMGWVVLRNNVVFFKLMGWVDLVVRWVDLAIPLIIIIIFVIAVYYPVVYIFFCFFLTFMNQLYRKLAGIPCAFYLIFVRRLKTFTR